MDDRDAHFLIVIGDVCVGAALAGLRIEVQTSDGRVLYGVPARAVIVPHEIVDENADEEHVVIDGQSVGLNEVTRCTVFAASAPRRSRQPSA